jgi:hypothetical protein
MLWSALLVGAAFAAESANCVVRPGFEALQAGLHRVWRWEQSLDVSRLFSLPPRRPLLLEFKD